MSEATYTLDDMTIDDIIEVLQSLVFNSYGRTTPKERYAISRAVDLIKCRSVKNAKEIYEMAKCLRPLTSIEKMFYKAADEAIKAEKKNENETNTAYEDFLNAIDSEPFAKMREIKEGWS